MRIGCLIFGALASFAASPSNAQSKDDLEAALRAIEEAADELERNMTPEERGLMNAGVEASATHEMQALAKECRTSLLFSNEAKFEDRTVWAAPDATAEQIVCVQRAYPFVKVYPK